MAQVTTTSLGEYLKRVYSPQDIEQLVNLTYPVLEECARKGSAMLGGSGFYIPVRTKSAEGHAFIDETDDLPAAQQSKAKTAVVTPKVQVGVGQLTGLSLSVSSGDAMAFARAFDENVQQTIEAMSAYREGALFRDGTGILATFVGDPAATVGPHAVTDVSYFRPGMFVDIWDDAANDLQLDNEIVDFSWSASPDQTVTFATALPAAVGAGDEIYIANSNTAGIAAPQNKEPIGLIGTNAAVEDTGTYLTIDRAVDSAWKSEVVTVSGFFDEDVLLRGRDRLTQRSGIGLNAMGGRMKVLCHPVQASTLFKLAIPRVRFSGTDSVDLGNAENVKFGGVPVVTSYQCPADRAILGDFSYVNTLYTSGGELHLDTQYNGSALKWVATKDAGLFFLKSYFAFACRRPNAFVQFKALSESTR